MNTTESVQKVTVFFSWQSDIKQNTNEIRKKLRKVIRSLKNDSSPEVILDEATRNTTGSPNIAMTILEKICQADIFVADLTTINPDNKEERKVQNPNVLFELGYAVAQLGWERIILVTFGDKDDLPFDIQNHRASEISDLQKAIQVIIDTNPDKPTIRLSEETLRRENDLKTIKKMMDILNIPTIERSLQRLPKFLTKDLSNLCDIFCDFKESAEFYLSDKDMLEQVDNFYNAFVFIRDDASLIFFPHEYTEDYILEDENDYEKLNKVQDNIKKELRNMLDYIRQNYPEIDFGKVNGES